MFRVIEHLVTCPFSGCPPHHNTTTNPRVAKSYTLIAIVAHLLPRAGLAYTNQFIPHPGQPTKTKREAPATAESRGGRGDLATSSSTTEDKITKAFPSPDRPAIQSTRRQQSVVSLPNSFPPSPSPKSHSTSRKKKKKKRTKVQTRRASNTNRV